MSKRKLVFRISRALAVGGLVASSSVMAVNCTSNPAPDYVEPTDAGDTGTTDTGPDIWVNVNPAPPDMSWDMKQELDAGDMNSVDAGAVDAAASDASTDTGSDADAAD